MIKPIEDLTELERRIIRHHILTYPHYTNGLSTLGIFNDVHQDESDAAISKLVQYGYYNKPQHHSVSWTPDGYHRCRNYFKDEINNAHNKTETNKAIPYPDKITIQWLKLYVPHHFWFWLGSALLAAFLAGVFVGQSKLYHDLTTKKEDSTSLTTNQIQVPTIKENKKDKMAAPIKNDTLKK